MFEFYLSQFVLSTGIGIFAGPEGSDIHLLGLFSHVLLVSRNGREDEIVTVDDHKERHEVTKYAVDQDVGSGEPVLGEVICSTGRHVSFGYISTNKSYPVKVCLFSNSKSSKKFKNYWKFGLYRFQPKRGKTVQTLA